MDAAGNGFAIWSQSDAGLYNVYVHRYTAGSGWSAPEILDQQTDNAYTAVVGFDAAGNAIAAYLGYDGTRNHVFSRRWVSGSGWTAEQRIDALPDDCENPEIAVNAAGNAVVAWYQSDENDGGWYGIASNYYTAGSGWGPDALIEQNNTGTALTPRVKLDASGNGIAVWYQSDGTRTSIWANRFLAASGWGTPELLETDDAGDAQFPRLDMNAAGDAIVAWQQSDGTRFKVRAIRFTPAGGWGMATLLETGDDDADGAVVAVDGLGNAMATWQASSDGVTFTTWTNRFDY